MAEKHESRIEMTLAQTLGVSPLEPEPEPLPCAKFSRQFVGSEEPQQLCGSSFKETQVPTLMYAGKPLQNFLVQSAVLRQPRYNNWGQEKSAKGL